MSSNNEIHLVLGISSVGKSSYIRSKIVGGEWGSLRVLMAHELENDSGEDLLDQSFVVHYNLFRPYNNSAENLANDLLIDTALTKLLKYRDRIKAYLLIAHRSTVAKRCLLRETVEPELRKVKNPYPSQQLFELLCRVDSIAFYKQWLSLLKEHRIQFEIIDSSDKEYSTISSEEDALSLLAADHSESYTSEEIDYIIKTNRFEYQRIELPSKDTQSSKTRSATRGSSRGWTRALNAAKRIVRFGTSESSAAKFTNGSDRSPTLKFLEADLSGKSLLDIGCAYGFFCFEAEKRNAARVVGTELKQHRFIGSNVIKEIYGKRTEFLLQDIFSQPLDESFDVVLLLNVIHHLPEPIKALRLTAGYCKEKLIIEFPTLSDKKFQSTLSNAQEFDSSLPIIGVSLLSKKDQTFLFSEEAIKRILMEHDKLFSSIEFHQSPISPDRRVAVCYK